MESPVSSPPSSPPGSSTVSPASSPDNSPSGSPAISPSAHVPNSSARFGPPPGPAMRPPPPFALPRTNMPAPPPAPPPPPPALGCRPIPPPPGAIYPYQPPHTKYAQINTPYDFLVPHEYFSKPQGFKPYHFRQCYMPTSSTYVIVEKGWSTQVDLDTYSSLLLRYHSRCHTDIRYKCTTEVPDTVRKPKIQVCPLLSTEMQRAIDRAVPPELEEEDPKLFARLKHLSRVEDHVVFFVVVQGRQDGAAAKLVVKATFYQIMTEMFYTASNDLNVVFSGVMREKDLQRLGKGARNSFASMLGLRNKAKCGWSQVRSNLRFKRVDNYDDLLEDDEDKNVIRVGC